MSNRVICKVTGGKDFLTFNKAYFVLEESTYTYLILSDYDCEVWINRDWFEENV
jgi:hypothetical protein